MVVFEKSNNVKRMASRIEIQPSCLAKWAVPEAQKRKDVGRAMITVKRMYVRCQFSSLQALCSQLSMSLCPLITATVSRKRGITASNIAKTELINVPV